MSTAKSNTNSTVITSSFISCGRYSRSSSKAWQAKPTDTSRDGCMIATPSPDSATAVTPCSTATKKEDFSSSASRRSGKTPRNSTAASSVESARKLTSKKMACTSKVVRAGSKTKKRVSRQVSMPMMTRQRMPVYDNETGSVTYMEVLMPIDDSSAFKVIPLRRSPRKHPTNYPNFALFKADNSSLQAPYVAPHNIAFPSSSPTPQHMRNTAILSSSPPFGNPFTSGPQLLSSTRHMHDSQVSQADSADFGSSIEETADKFACRFNINESPLPSSHRPFSMDAPESSPFPKNFLSEEDPLLQSPENTTSALLLEMTPVKSTLRSQSLGQYDNCHTLDFGSTTPLKSRSSKKGVDENYSLEWASSPSYRKHHHDLNQKFFDELFSEP